MLENFTPADNQGGTFKCIAQESVDNLQKPLLVKSNLTHRNSGLAAL